MKEHVIGGLVYRECPSYPGLAASSDGHVARVKRDILGNGRKLPYVLKPCESKGKPGRFRFCVIINGMRKYISRSSLVCDAWHGPRPSPEMHCCHNNGVPSDDRACNLRWDTPSGNAADKRIHGTWQGGENSAKAAISQEVADLIRSEYDGKWGGVRGLSKKYGLSEGVVGNVLMGVTYCMDPLASCRAESVAIDGVDFLRSGINGLYVSSCGKVAQVKHSLLGDYRAILDQSVSSRGFHYVKRVIAVHKLICQVFHGDRPDDSCEAWHINGDRSDNRASNLCWLSSTERKQRREEAKKMHSRGESHYNARLTWTDVYAIRSSSGKRGYLKRLASSLGVSKSAIDSVRSYRKWNAYNMDGVVHRIRCLADHAVIPELEKMVKHEA